MKTKKIEPIPPLPFRVVKNRYWANPDGTLQRCVICGHRSRKDDKARHYPKCEYFEDKK